MAFAVSADAYDRFMGRYSVPLAAEFADFAGVAPPARALDVGSGPGALTTELVRRLGSASVVAVDPSESFVEAARERHPGVDVRRATAEELPFGDDEFDTALAQLVVHFMGDPVAGLREMARVTRQGGVVAACVWDHAGGLGPLSPFWDSARELGSEIEDESRVARARAGDHGGLVEAAGLADVDDSTVSSRVEHRTFDEWWEPFTLGVGPAGVFTSRLDDDTRSRLRELCRARLPEPPFTLTATAWAARGRA